MSKGLAFTSISYEKIGKVAKIKLNRPESLNALSLTMLRELAEALSIAENDGEVRCVVITGEGRGFCSGADLQELKEYYEKGQPPNLGENLRKMFNPIILKIRNMEKPVIALINGPAAGAGLGIALACDIRIASEDARLITAFAKVGLVMDSGTNFFLVNTVGLAKALELAFTGEGFSAEEAKELGLVNMVVRREELDSIGMDYAHKLSEGPTKAFGYSKRLLNRAVNLSLDDTLKLEAETQELAGKTKDHLEGVKAFVEKRKPMFVGE